MMRNSNIAAIVIIISTLSSMISIYVLKTIPPFIAIKMSALGILVARILYIGFLMYILVPPLAGYLSDIFGYRRVIIITTILESASIFLCTPSPRTIPNH